MGQADQVIEKSVCETSPRVLSKWAIESEMIVTRRAERLLPQWATFDLHL
jgi:hypothetical protein